MPAPMRVPCQVSLNSIGLNSGQSNPVQPNFNLTSLHQTSSCPGTARLSMSFHLTLFCLASPDRHWQGNANQRPSTMTMALWDVGLTVARRPI